MCLINLAFVGLIWLADSYTRLTDPFDEFTRQPMPLSLQSLEAKEETFFNDLIMNFRAVDANGILVWNYKHMADESLDLGDQALWHGVTTYMLCLKYKARPTPELAELIIRSARGMMLHQRVAWEDRPRLVRGVRDSVGREFQDDASNDTLTGHVLGLYGLIKCGIPQAAAIGIQLSRSMADSLVDHNMCLTNADGSNTTHGKLVNGLLSDGLNLSVALTVLKLASSTWTGRLDYYEEVYAGLVSKYKQRIPYGHVTLGRWGHDYDAHRPAICYMILADLEKDHDINRLYVKGLMRSWKRERKTRSPWIYYLMRKTMLLDPSDLNGCLIRLAEMEPAQKAYVQQRINSTDEAFWKERGVRFFKRGDNLRSSQPLPLWKMGSQDFFWQRCQYSVDDWLGLTEGQFEHNGVDFLVAYWGLRELKLR